MLLRARQENSSWDQSKECDDISDSHDLIIDSQEEREIWSKIEDERLKYLVKILGENSWKKVAEYFKTKSARRCRHRWFLSLKTEKLTSSYIRSPKLPLDPMGKPGLDTFDIHKRRVFSKEEDEKLVEMVQKYGSNNWSLIAQHMKGRSGSQCKKRWRDYSDPALKKGTAFTLEEEGLLTHYHELWGDQWSKIATVLPGRSCASIRYHWRYYLEKKRDASDGLKVQESAIQSDVQQEEDGKPVGFKNPLVQKSAIHSDVQQEKDSSVGFKNPIVQKKRKCTSKESTRPASRKRIQADPVFSDEEFQTPALESNDNASFHAASTVTDVWSQDEDKRLKSLVETLGHNRWKRIAAYFPSKTDVQCYMRYRFVLNVDGVFKGRFTEQEDKKLTELVREHGRSWNLIAPYLPGRTEEQCMHRWDAIMDPPSGDAPWTYKERRLIIYYQKHWGNSWSKIVELLPGRTVMMIQNYWHSVLKKQVAASKRVELKKKRLENLTRGKSSTKFNRTTSSASKVAESPHHGAVKKKVVKKRRNEEERQKKVKSKEETLSVVPPFESAPGSNYKEYRGDYSCFNDSSRKETSEGQPELEHNLYVFPVKEEPVTSPEEFQMIPVSNTESPELQPKIVSVASLKVKEESQLSVDLLPENIHVSPFSDGVNLNGPSNNTGSFCDLPIHTLVNSNQISFPNIPKENSVAAQDHIGCIISGIDTLKEHQISRDSLPESRSLYEHNAQHKSVKSSCVKSEDPLLSAMKIIYFQAKEDLATKKFSALEDLMSDLSCSSLAALNVSSYLCRESYDYLDDIEAALASVIQEEIVKQINEARWYSIIIDECSDVSMELSLIIYVQFALKGKVVTRFLCLTEIEEVSSKQIIACIQKTFEKLGIYISKCSSLAIDGPSVGRGVRSEVAALFRKHNPHLLSVHCVAHRISLALTQAAEEFPYLIKYRDILKRAHSYFEKSPAKTNRLHHVQQVLGLTNQKLLKLSAIRWLSLGNSVLNVDTFWSGLVSVFKEDNCPESQGLLKQTTSYMFLATTAMLNDVVFCVNKLQMAFQKKNLDFEFAQACVIACLGNLRSMRNKTGTSLMDFLNKTLKDEGKSFIYELHVVTDSIEQRNKFEVLMDSFLFSMIGHIEDRLGDMDQIELFNIFLPSNLPDTPSEFEVYGKKEISKIFQLLHSFLDFVDYEESEWLSEWAFFKVVMQKRLKNMTIQEVFEFILINDMSQECPLICSVIEYALTIPLHTRDCERGFSALKHNKTSSKNRKNMHQVNHRLTIKIEGPDRQKFDFYQALEKWADIRKNKLQLPQTSKI